MYCRRFRATLSVSTCRARQVEAGRPWGYRQESTSIGACDNCAQGRLAAAGKERDDDMEHLMKAANVRANDYSPLPGTPITRDVLDELIRRLRRFKEAVAKAMDPRPSETA